MSVDGYITGYDSNGDATNDRAISTSALGATRLPDSFNLTSGSSIVLKDYSNDSLFKTDIVYIRVANSNDVISVMILKDVVRILSDTSGSATNDGTGSFISIYPDTDGNIILANNFTSTRYITWWLG